MHINNQNIDIAHRVPTRQATAGPRPVICKFTRRIVKEEVINLRKEVCKVSAAAIGLSAEFSLSNVKIFDHLTPQTQKLLVDAKKFQTRNRFQVLLVKKILLSISEGLRVLVLFGSKEDLPMS